jgi:MoxR-like ATPase
LRLLVGWRVRGWKGMSVTESASAIATSFDVAAATSGSPLGAAAPETPPSFATNNTESVKDPHRMNDRNENGWSRPEATALAGKLVAALDSVLLGIGQASHLVVAAVLARGHVLVEDRPGVGKTLLAKTLAAAIGGTSARVQGSVDVLPADITGGLVLRNTSNTSNTNTANTDTGTSSPAHHPHQSDDPFRFMPGPIFHNVVIIDELNRISPRAQAALLEAMEERHVTVDGQPKALPDPFIVVATQNHTSSTGTYPLLQGQIDRFTVGITLGLPSATAETALLLGTGGTNRLSDLATVCSPSELLSAQQITAKVHLAPPIASYIVAIAQITRDRLGDGKGASPRASLMIAAVARALAVMAGRDYVAPDDVQAAVFPVLGMRLHGDTNEADARARISSYLSDVPVPRP